jgi:hypothetical protein
MNTLLVNFLQKFFFILHVAAKGWKIRYLGGNKFKITRSITKNEIFPILPRGFRPPSTEGIA